MPSRRPAVRFQDIVDNIQLIHSYLAAMDRAAFDADRRTRDAVERCLERISEFDITFTNNGGQNPTISHLTLTGGDPRPPTSVPEPGTLALLGTGLLGLGFSLRRRHH